MARTGAEVGPDDVVFVQFSSGSTSQPKGVRITHRGLLYNLSLIVDNDRRSEASVWVSWLPLYHDMGLVRGLLTNFILRNTLVLMPPRCFIARPLFWLEAITRFRGTVTAIPNFALDICTRRISEEQLRDSRLDLSSLRYVYIGSEPVRPSSIRRFEERFGPFGFVPGSIYPVYGMAEATLIVSAPAFGRPETIRIFEGMEVPSVGYPLGDFQVEIRDEEGRRLGADRVGEIHLRGTSVSPGYLEDGEGAGGSRGDRWLATGDLGFLDAEGRLYITGRKKDLLIVQGQDFYGHHIAACAEEGLGLRPGTVHAFAVDGEGGSRWWSWWRRRSRAPGRASGRRNAAPTRNVCARPSTGSFCGSSSSPSATSSWFSAFPRRRAARSCVTSACGCTSSAGPDRSSLVLPLGHRPIDRALDLTIGAARIPVGRLPGDGFEDAHDHPRAGQPGDLRDRRGPLEPAIATGRSGRREDRRSVSSPPR